MGHRGCPIFGEDLRRSMRTWSKMHFTVTMVSPRKAMLIIISLSLFLVVILHLNVYKVKTKEGHCIPHGMLLALYGQSDPCNEAHLVLHCSDPYLEYIHDPQVLNSCRITQSIPQRNVTLDQADIFAKLPATTKCHHTESTLLSDKQLPVKPSPVLSFSDGLVPNIVHYVSLGCERTFSFANYLSVLSVHKFVHPDVIYFHGECTPIGLWWERTLQDVPNIYFRKRRRQKTIQGRPPMWIEHETDVIRLQVLLAEGGIYLDTDVFVLSSLDPLRHYTVTLGREFYSNNSLLGSSFIMAQPNSPFICMWLSAFREYNPQGDRDWAKYATITPGKISMQFPEHVHVESTSFYRPSWYELHKIYDGFYDWSQNYVLHMWNKGAQTQVIPDNPSAIPSKHEVNCTIHEIFRYIYFDERIITAKKCNNVTSIPRATLARCFDTLDCPANRKIKEQILSSTSGSHRPMPFQSTSIQAAVIITCWITR